ncbi:hypothetical protein JKA74_18690 [Marivirga sp. S37H4]|uniref:Pectate lyase superfamily protein domain-containing protein n=1 Tax=Marivirga aurantiaca TaxID=2802615 RepID=A0A934X1R0_9BACT|nr:hypothetical protein [Marivirga aurantiaca]MBK6267079.1 hypothetical protein [Marivirga aurantiaca]
MKRILLVAAFFTFIILSSNAQIDSGSLFIDPEKGKNTNIGTEESPIQSLFEASERLNKANGRGAVTIYLSPGIYGLDATVTFHPVNWHFTREERLTIRSTVNPDDEDWNPGKMPVIVSTMPLNFKPYGKPDPIGGASYGIQIETSHVTIQGLRILGSPVHETPEEGLVRRNYPIVREGEHLDDLRITQCLFIGDRHAIPNHVGVLASGQGIVVDHCIFYKVKDAVVFWQSEEPAKDSEMHHNLIISNYGAAVWSWTLDEDFKYYNNVVTGANIFWILDKDEKNTFTISNSMVVGYDQLVNKGGGASGFGEKGNQKKLKLSKDVIIKKEGTLQIVEDLTSKYYLHIKPGTEGSNLKAGLFTK